MESINDALIDCVKALGGSKQVGPMLWPEKTPDAAQRTLLDALNPDRPNRLAPEQVLLLLRKARAAGSHDALSWILGDLGYAAPIPVEPVDELAQLQREFIQATQIMSQDLRRMEELQSRIAQQQKLKAVA